jgi:hypothetical protein
MRSEEQSHLGGECVIMYGILYASSAPLTYTAVGLRTAQVRWQVPEMFKLRAILREPERPVKVSWEITSTMDFCNLCHRPRC